MILHQIQALAAAGVTDIVLAVNYRPEIMTAALKKVCSPPSPPRPGILLTLEL
jgi:mannose-1-phosphate guanylyltransferase